MTDTQEQFRAYKAEARRHQEKLDHVSSNDEALDLLIQQADSLMKAMKIAPSPQEKSEISTNVRNITSVAHRIKSGEEWKPKVTPTDSAPSSRAVSGSATLRGTLSTQTNNTQHLADRSSQAKENEAAESRKLSLIKDTTNASSSKQRRIAVPVSTRNQSNKEKITVLRASTINGVKYVPWDKDPTGSEFCTATTFTDFPELALSPYQMQFFDVWAPATRALPPPSMRSGRDRTGPVMQTDAPVDLVQDAATDCSVVASMCTAISRAERGHDELLANLVWPYDSRHRTPVISANGKYIVRLYFNGCWRKVVVDDRLPQSHERILHVIDRNTPNLLYPALLEKAYLKVRGGYDFPGSNSCGDLFALTGWIPEQVYLQEAETIPDQLWTRAFHGFHYGHALVTVGTGKMSSRQERDLGLESQHSYAVLDMKETNGERILLLKNPWAEGKGWRGARPSAAPVKSVSISSAGPYPTTFWIGLEQLMQHFESIYLNWNSGMFGHRQDIHFQWNLDEPTPQSGNCVLRHPQFSLSTKGNDKVWLLLSRHFLDTLPAETNDSVQNIELNADTSRDTSADILKGYMSILVCEGRGGRIYMKDTRVERGAYVNTPQSLLKFQSDRNKDYVVVIDQEELPTRQYSFTLSAFSDSQISLEPVATRYAHSKTERNSWTKATAGGSTNRPTYFDNPQYTLEVKNKGAVAILLSSEHHRNPLHVRLALGYGKRLYRLRGRDVIAHSGEHREACAFAEAKEVQPGLYTIICSLFEPGKTGDYTLQVDSDSEIALRPIPRDGAGLIPMKLSHAVFSPTVNKIAAPIVPRRLISTFVITRFLTARSPRAQDLGMVARSPLRVSIEQGRGPDRIFFTASEGGEYSDAAIVRTESVDLDPAFLEGGDLWIVLERLSSPGGPVEEVYEVELFSDTPKPVQVGVWREWS